MHVLENEMHRFKNQKTNELNKEKFEKPVCKYFE